MSYRGQPQLDPGRVSRDSNGWRCGGIVLSGRSQHAPNFSCPGTPDTPRKEVPCPVLRRSSSHGPPYSWSSSPARVIPPRPIRCPLPRRSAVLSSGSPRVRGAGPRHHRRGPEAPHRSAGASRDDPLGGGGHVQGGRRTSTRRTGQARLLGDDPGATGRAPCRGLACAPRRRVAGRGAGVRGLPRGDCSPSSPGTPQLLSAKELKVAEQFEGNRYVGIHVALTTSEEHATAPDSLGARGRARPTCRRQGEGPDRGDRRHRDQGRGPDRIDRPSPRRGGDRRDDPGPPTRETRRHGRSR